MHFLQKNIILKCQELNTLGKTSLILSDDYIDKEWGSWGYTILNKLTDLGFSVYNLGHNGISLGWQYIDINSIDLGDNNEGHKLRLLTDKNNSIKNIYDKIISHCIEFANYGLYGCEYSLIFERYLKSEHETNNELLKLLNKQSIKVFIEKDEFGYNFNLNWK